MFFAARLTATKKEEEEGESNDDEEKVASKVPLADVAYKPENEREAMQEKTFRKWINLQLKKVEASPINDVIKDIRDGKKILVLLEILTGEKFPREKGRMRIHALNNINRALQILQDRSVKVSNVNSADIVDGHQKIILSFIWLIIQHFWHSAVDEEVPECRKFTMEQALLRWCRKVTLG
uniref:Calponin-homology (CH) domain-containing protein n=1 Tax=Romanomermis culicivorax TaxID=13658 RepID=A0A915HI85_ROMCU